MAMKRRYLVYIYTQYANGALRKPIKRSYNKLRNAYDVPAYLTIKDVSVFDILKGEWL